MKKVTIKSYWSEMDWRDTNNLDGYYCVNVPKKHETDYKEFISCAGQFLDEIRSGNIDGNEDIASWFEDYEVKGLSKTFCKKNFELAKGWAEEGANLNSTFGFLRNSKGERGWSFEKLYYVSEFNHCYDADYCRFEW